MISWDMGNTDNVDCQVIGNMKCRLLYFVKFSMLRRLHENSICFRGFCLMFTFVGIVRNYLEMP